MAKKRKTDPVAERVRADIEKLLERERDGSRELGCNLRDLISPRYSVKLRELIKERIRESLEGLEAEGLIQRPAFDVDVVRRGRCGGG